jgi:hypothetical protein
MLRFTGVLVVALLATGSAFSADAAKEFAAKQQQFKKLYGNNDPTERVTAVAELDGLTDAETLKMLHYVVVNDKAGIVRAAAFEQLTKVPTRNGNHANMLVALFQLVKMTDMDLRLDMARMMANSQFKYAVTDALADFGSKLRYPDPYTGTVNRQNHSGGGASTTTNDPTAGINRQRKEFEKFISAFNSITNAGLKAADRNSPAEVKKWWEANKAKFAAADREIADKYKAEDQAAKDKDNPLTPDKKDKKG